MPRKRSTNRHINPQGYIDMQAQRIRDCLRELADVEQILGKALKYPLYADDQKNFPGTTEADGVCTGEHTAKTLADEAAARIAVLEYHVMSTTKEK